MLQINKQEFFKEFNLGDIFGLENLEKQLDNLYKEINENLKANVDTNGEIINKSVTDILCELEENVVKQQTLLKYVIQLNYIFVETETTKYASDYYNLAYELYHKALNDLFIMLDITEEDFENNERYYIENV